MANMESAEEDGGRRKEERAWGMQGCRESKGGHEKPKGIEGSRGMEERGGERVWGTHYSPVSSTRGWACDRHLGSDRHRY